MVLTRDEFFEAINKRVGRNTDDESLKFIEDMTDTYNSLDVDRSIEEWEKNTTTLTLCGVNVIVGDFLKEKRIL